jgi:hypothetical protein
MMTTPRQHPARLLKIIEAKRRRTRPFLSLISDAVGAHS